MTLDTALGQEFRRHSRTISQVIARYFLSSSFEEMKDNDYYR